MLSIANKDLAWTRLFVLNIYSALEIQNCNECIYFTSTKTTNKYSCNFSFYFFNILLFCPTSIQCPHSSDQKKDIYLNLVIKKVVTNCARLRWYRHRIWNGVNLLYNLWVASLVITMYLVVYSCTYYYVMIKRSECDPYQSITIKLHTKTLQQTAPNITPQVFKIVQIGPAS